MYPHLYFYIFLPAITLSLPHCSPPFQVIAALFYNPSMLIELLEKTRFSESTEAITSQFLSQWIKDADLFMGCVVSSFEVFIDL